MSTTETPEASATDVRPKVKKLRGPRTKRTELTPAQQDLATHYLPLARTLAKSTKLNWPNHRDEIDSAALMALVEAAQAFNPRRGVKFPTFARLRIMGALCDIRRYLHNKGYPRQLPNVPRSFHFVPGAEESALLMLTSPDGPVGAEVEATEQVEHWLRALPTRHAQACRELYIRDRNQGQAAEAIGCVKSRVCTLNTEALDLLRSSPAVREAALAIGLDVGRN